MGDVHLEGEECPFTSDNDRKAVTDGLPVNTSCSIKTDDRKVHSKTIRNALWAIRLHWGADSQSIGMHLRTLTTTKLRDGDIRGIPFKMEVISYE